MICPDHISRCLNRKYSSLDESPKKWDKNEERFFTKRKYYFWENNAKFYQSSQEYPTKECKMKSSPLKNSINTKHYEENFIKL